MKNLYETKKAKFQDYSKEDSSNFVVRKERLHQIENFWVFQVDYENGKAWNETPIREFHTKKEAIKFAEEQVIQN